MKNICKVSKEMAFKDFNVLKKEANTLLGQGSFSKLINTVSCAANIAYHLNFTFSDDDLDSILKNIGEKSYPNEKFKGVKNRYVFYDSFGLDGRGLTQQYIDSLLDMNVEFLYIVEKKLGQDSDILKKINSSSNATVYMVDSKLNKLETGIKLVKLINEYKPEKAFLHLAPWSSLAVSVWATMDSVERYMIDLTDHAFWLGKNCADFFIGFRDYGLSVSLNYRGIPRCKLLKNSYYPIQNTRSSFKKKIFDSNGRLILFSGGSLYKTYGFNYKFLKIIKRVLDENNNVCFIFVGSGNEKPFKKFVKDNNLEGKIILFPEVKDINNFFNIADIYINTYPIIGGLMSQLAIKNRVPIIGYSSSEIPCNYSEGLFNTTNGRVLTFTNTEDFHIEINKMIKDKSYRKSFKFERMVPTPEEFRLNLENIIKSKEILYFPSVFNQLEFNVFSGLYFDMENNYLKQYHLIKLRWLGIRYFRIDFYMATLSYLCFFINYSYFIDRFLKKIKNVSRAVSKKMGVGF